ncbi:MULTISPECIES: OsmC family peroxiredoxin [Sphingobacterium]|uniref:OsmC family peroxiredoxin n=1 Tax=Sphingobacterium kitahiroshimense TaxID=470446 RepID=A0ABV0C0S8_9SPHI|nr:OsmC family peroxiredoxin [Sphingobacterium faecium]PTX07191.1 osmotically inducible protein OsmC [Sphingobacterium faecium]GEM65701.1 peroxiredoxin [Sphingobacterium faecium NBRC 15299]
METSVKAVWQGSFKQGNGQLDIENSKLNSIAFKPSYAKNDGSFSNPEELLASAHASCYTMTLAYILGENGLSADTIETSISLVISNNVISNSNLTLQAKIPAITEEQFQVFAQKAKEMCPIGNALKIDISLEAILLK